jgi:hypothetical protein
MEKKRVVAYWNVYDAGTGSLIEKEKAIVQRAMPCAGQLMIGIPGRFHAIVKRLKFHGTRNKLPCYDVYV